MKKGGIYNGVQVCYNSHGDVVNIFALEENAINYVKQYGGYTKPFILRDYQ